MTIDDVTAGWRKAGIAPGDMVLVHSSLRRLLADAAARATPLTPDDVLDSLLSAVGETGTLLLPLFNFGFARGEGFDIRTTPSEMGALTERARLRAGAVRTGHPIYSFAVLGARAGLFAGVDNRSGYGADSPFGLLRDHDGKIAVIDLPDQHSMTFYHHVEEAHGVPYRFFKTFTGPYTDAAGETRTRAYDLYVRDLAAGVETHVDPAGEIAWAEGLYTGDRPGTGSGMRVVRARALYDLTARLITTGRAEGTLFRRAPT